MTMIGKPKRVYTVEPLEIPVPAAEPRPAPHPTPVETPCPSRVPETVGARLP